MREHDLQIDTSTAGGSYPTLAEVRAALANPPMEIIRTKRGDDGEELRYVPWHKAADLFDQLGLVWSWRPREIQRWPDRVAFIGELGIRCAEGMIWRGATGECGLPFKGKGGPAHFAESTAFRRAAAKFGLCRSFYGVDEGTGAAETGKTETSGAAPESVTPASIWSQEVMAEASPPTVIEPVIEPPPEGPAVGQAEARPAIADAEQKRRLQERAGELCRRVGRTKEQLDEWIAKQAKYGGAKRLEELGVRDLEEVVDMLGKKAGQGRAVGSGAGAGGKGTPKNLQ